MTDVIGATLPANVRQPTKKLVFVLDETGSMGPYQSEVIEAVNSYMRKMRDESNLYVTLYTFNSLTGPRGLAVNVPAQSVPLLTTDNYQPDHTTPLFDAIGYGINDAARSDADKKLVTIYTDGEENASREYTLKMIQDMVEKHKEDIVFTFLGADIDAYRSGHQFGFARGGTMDVGLQTVCDSMQVHADATRRYFRSGVTGQSATQSFYTEEEKLKAERPKDSSK